MNPRVLIVDDDRDICFTVETIGAYAGWSVLSCPDVRSALSSIKGFAPDVILLDYHLPFMNGLTALPEFRRRAPGTSIIMLTVEDDGIVAEKCRKAGANDFSLKPIKALDLIYRINLNLEASRLRGLEERQLSGEPLPKGMNQETLDLFMSYMREQTEPFTINQSAHALQLGYSTAHRYLNYLESQGHLLISHGYGKQGRPQKRYMSRTK